MLSDAVKRKLLIVIKSLFFNIRTSPRTTRVPSGHSSHIYNSGFCVACHEIITVEMKGAHVQIVSMEL